VLCLPPYTLTVITVSVFHATCDWPQSPHWHNLFMSLSFSQSALENPAQTFMSRLIAFLSTAGGERHAGR
jgi:hypothetical protein